MKVCFLSVTHAYDDTRVLHKEAHALASAGYTVDHVAPTQSGSEEVRPPFVVDGVTVQLYARGGRLIRMWRLFLLARRLRAHCYHCNEVESWVVGLLMKILRPSTTIVFDVHEHYPSRFSEPHMPAVLRKIGPPIMTVMLKTLPWCTDYLILAKRCILADLPERYRRRDCVFNYGVMRMRVRAREQVSSLVRSHFDSSFTAVHIGGFSKARGWPQLLEALARTRHKVRALCLGEVDEGLQVLMEEAGRLGLENRVMLRERVPYDEMFDYLSMSDVGLMLYQPHIFNHVYAFPMKLYDYMWAGLPSIGPSFSVEVEPVINGERCGICIDTANPDALAAALDWLVENPQEAKEMGARGREAIRTTYNWETQAQRLVAIYEQLLGPPTSADGSQSRARAT